MKFLHEEDSKKELTYEDVFIIPQKSDIHSRMDVDLKASDQLNLSIPIIVSNMNAVAGKRMAETVTRRGGLVVLPQDKPYEELQKTISYIQSCHHVFETPIVLKENQSLQKALNLIHKRSHRAVLVVDDAYQLAGICTESDAQYKDLYTPLSKAMTKEVISMPHTSHVKDIYNTLHEKHLPIMPIINEQGKLIGVLTKKGAIRAQIYKPALNQRQSFYTAVAVGINKNLEERIIQLMNIGVDLIVLDTAHGHQTRMIQAIKTARAILGKDKPLCAGNIVTKEAAYDFIQAGASILKVGVGPGAMCTTRMMTGVGRPQFSAVHDVACVAKQAHVEVWADGGCQFPRDIVLALASGANAVMIGSWFAGTYESAADIQIDSDGRMYKENFGMASHRAVIDRTATIDPFEKGKKELFVEGISAGKMYVKPGQESVEDIIDQITAGIRSACAYTGARNLKEFYEKVIVSLQTMAGYKEGKAVYKR